MTMPQCLAADRQLSPLFVRQPQPLAVERLGQHLILRAQVFDRRLLAPVESGAKSDLAECCFRTGRGRASDTLDILSTTL
jgi:hypothetical protein